MAKVLQTTLQISESNVEQYCTADGLSLNTGGYAIRLYLNGHTQGSAILNSAAKEVLYPSATAHPFKIDSFIRANKSAGSMTISLRFDGTSVQSETGDWGSGLKNKIKEGISDPVVINSNRSTEIKWHIKGSSTVSRFSIASTKLTFYFNQYEMRPLIGNNANGIQKVTVSNASPCYGDTVVFTPKLVQGATWDGWYSDAACTNLVSTDQNYSVSPSSDITLYAKATIDATLYNVSAVAGAEIASVNVSDSIVPEGSTATFTAQVNTGCSFEAWYSDDTYTTVVSTENPYTATITANTTLYAKAHRNSLNMSVGSAEHGTASVSATTVPYGNDVTFTFIPEDETWELYGWYSDSALTQLVSEANPYTFTATEDTALYPKVGRIRYTITLTTAERFNNNTNKIMSYDYSLLTDIEKTYLKTGEFDKIEQNKIFEQQTVKGQWLGTKTASIQCPLGYAISIYLESNEAVVIYLRRDNIDLTAWPYYTTFPTEDQDYLAVKGDNACYCEAVMVDGILSTDATTPVSEGKEAIFTAEIMAGYTFSGWYSDRACTTLVSTDNPAKVTTPKNTDSGAISTTLTLYAKATKAIYTIGVGTAEHGSASVSATTAYYGDTVTFNCAVDEGYEFNGWYSDEGLTQLVSESAEYVHSVTGDVTLWPKVEIKIYNLIIHPTGYDEINSLSGITITNIDCLYTNDKSASTYASFTIPNSTRDNPVGIGFYVDGSKFSDIPDNATNIRIGINSTMAMIAPSTAYISETYTAKRNLVDGTPSYVKVGNSVWNGIPIHTGAFTFIMYQSDGGSWNVADLKDGKFGIFLGLYNTSFSNRTVNIYNIDISISYKLLPKVSATNLSFKLNGTWKNALAVFKKTNGVWVKQSNPASLFNGSPSGTESNYLYLGE